MLFGAVVCSPYKEHEVRNRNASHFQDFHPRAAKTIHELHYRDDYLDSADTEDETIGIIKDVIMIQQKGGSHG